jgi:hypothetical protein
VGAGEGMRGEEGEKPEEISLVACNLGLVLFPLTSSRCQVCR